MKLATMNDGSRDGKLAVVSKDLTRYTDASFLVPTLQAAIDNWMRVAPHLAAMAESLETGAVPSLRFHEHDAHSPLPRSYQWIDMAASGPVQRGSDTFIGPRDPIVVSDGVDVLHCTAKVAVVIDDVEMGASLEEAREAIRLVLLVNDIGTSKPKNGSSEFGTRLIASFSPVAVTPDELDDLWARSRLASPLLVDLDSRPVEGSREPGEGADFATAVFQAAKSRHLGAGTILSAGAVVDKKGDAFVALPPESTIRIEMKDRSGHSIFGAIEQGNGVSD